MTFDLFQKFMINEQQTQLSIYDIQDLIRPVHNYITYKEFEQYLFSRENEIEKFEDPLND